VFGFTALAVLLGASTFGKVAGFYLQRGRLQGALHVAPGGQDPNRLKECLGDARKAAEALKQTNLFVKTPPKEHPVKQVEGILGAEALIAGKWYKTGDQIGDAKIVTIAATLVEIEWDGKKTSFSPMAAAGGGPSAPPGARDPRAGAGPQPPKPPGATVVRTPASGPAQDDPFAWVGVKLSPNARAKLMEMWNNASPEERERGKQEWNQLSDEQKQQFVDRAERNL